MENKDFTSSILVEKDPQTAYNAIKNFRGWWSEEIEGPTDKLNETFFYHYKDIHLCKMKLTEALEGKRLVYLVTENHFNFIEDQTEWVGTRLVFDISMQDGKTLVKFTHEGLVPSYACYKICNDAWTGYIQNSLFKFINTGTGEPNPKDKDGFNAELAEKWKLNKTQDFNVSFLADQTPAEIYKAILDVPGWWSGEVKGKMQVTGDEFTYRVADVHYSKQRLETLVPFSKIVWRVTESRLGFTQDQSEWTNTSLVFDIIPENGKTRVTFTHAGLVPRFECYENCSKAWSRIIGESLKSLVTTGKGVKIF